MGVATAIIGVLRRTPVLLTPAIWASIVATSIQAITTIGTSGLASGVSSRGSSELLLLFF